MHALTTFLNGEAQLRWNVQTLKYHDIQNTVPPKYHGHLLFCIFAQFLQHFATVDNHKISDSWDIKTQTIFWEIQIFETPKYLEFSKSQTLNYHLSPPVQKNVGVIFVDASWPLFVASSHIGCREHSSSRKESSSASFSSSLSSWKYPPSILYVLMMLFVLLMCSYISKNI